MKRFITWSLIVVLVIAAFSGCGVKKNSGAKESGELIVTTSDTYPIETDTEITWWIQLPNIVAEYAGSMNEIPFKEYLEEETGISVNFIHPPADSVYDAFSLLIASMDLPDIIEYNWLIYPGGAQKAIAEDIIIPLDEYIDKVSPNVKRVFEENPDIRKQATMDDGTYFCYPFMNHGGVQATSMGFIVRDDLLKKEGMQPPVTLEEWNAVLYHFKELGIETPLYLRMDDYLLRQVSPFTNLFGTYTDFYVENGQIKYGPIEEGYKEWVIQLKKWYDDGILNMSFEDSNDDVLNDKVIKGEIGVTFCYAGSELGRWLPAIEESGSDIRYTPVQYPSPSRDEKPKFGQMSQRVGNPVCVITTQCENKEIAARLLDYGYSEKGSMLYNFGREGVSYNMINDYPTYTDIITDRSRNGKLPIGQAMSKYMRSCYYGPFMQDVRYNMQLQSSQTQKDALRIWGDTRMDEFSVPYLSMSEEENKEYSRILQDISDYKQKMLIGFINGTESIENYDKYLQYMKELHIEHAIEIKQTAYDRYGQK